MERKKPSDFPQRPFDLFREKSRNPQGYLRSRFLSIAEPETR